MRPAGRRGENGVATEYWITITLVALVALVAGFVAGRMSAPRQRHIESMRQERDQARKEADEVRSEVNRHFEESARMFGKLASDYRSFFQQFARTAQNLGLSEGQARALLQQADPSLVARRPDGVTAGAAETEGAAVPRGAAATAGVDETAGPESAPPRDDARERTEAPERTAPRDDGTAAAADADTERRE